ncbi:MAG: hypothetical protein RJA36_3097 [Pseudomonadota bacterium]|jgi:hypothetical protein
MLGITPSGLPSFEEARTAARGRWRAEILPSLGISVPDTSRKHGPCPGCGGLDRFRFDDKDGEGSFICGQGGGEPLAGDGFTLVSHALHVTAKEALRRVAGIVTREAPAAPPPVSLRQVTTYPYADADGVIRYEVVRLEDPHAGKTFRIRRGTAWGLGTETPLPYRLPELLAAPADATIWICEGEKDADRLAALGLVATCNHGGAGNWHAPLTPHLAGRRCVILQDNDEAGARHVARVAAALTGVASSAHILRLPNLPPKGDVSDWLDAGGTLAELQQAARAIQTQPVSTPIPLTWLVDIRPALEAHDFVEGVLTDGGMSVTYGDSNTGKTFFAVDLALHVAAGKTWRGREVEQGGVIYLALEGTAGIRNRVVAWLHYHDLRGASLPLAIATTPIDLLSSDADAQALVATIKAAAAQLNVPVRLIVIDTLSRALAGGNENASEDMGALVRHIDLIRAATGAHVMIIHHSGKDQARGARGHSLLRAATDTEIEVTRPDRDSPALAKPTKQRELDCSGEWRFNLAVVDLGYDRRGTIVTSCVAIEADAPAPKAADRTKGLGKQQKLVLDELKLLLASDAAEDPPASSNAPPTVRRVVRESVWRAAVYPHLEGRAAQTFSRALKALQEKERSLVACLNLDPTGGDPARAFWWTT